MVDQNSLSEDSPMSNRGLLEIVDEISTYLYIGLTGVIQRFHRHRFCFLSCFISKQKQLKVENCIGIIS